MRAVHESERDLLRHHGDVEVDPGMLDFAVNVRGDGPPAWLRERLAARLGGLGRYPSAAEDLATRRLVAARHGRAADEVLLLAGGAEGFAMLPRLQPRLAAVVHPSFTEPELALREAGVPVLRVPLDPPYRLDPGRVRDDADLVVLGNPTNPTSVLHPAESVLALRRPGRLVVVDEAFADATVGEPESVADRALPDVLVLRSLTKTWALAGLRCGYALGSPDVLARLAHGRAHWPLSSLQTEAIAACSEPDAVAQAQLQAQRIATERAAMVEQLRAAPVQIALPAAGPFLLLRVPDGELVRKRLREKGIAVRRGDTFPGLGPDHIRVAVRPAAEVTRLVGALVQVCR
ncbi:Rv2231c family pyridoxal phosphate-dependent protein CobC [Aldersonia sp. NBC_00410]|uniref:Rv2231c family pyridoxal phosphate-dependent protein CobC n=1 Tax=Aldersonia sp. NBC_00410 TaxID=2975954 RepID=UPI002250D57D|nr:Rv2231c family pyridoxal phosphate-dependent protein CobC [Aldersonia sp. NBC_00410]MCX5042642.1 Rv2231c family pyridoxal phosphate-dependent protein CobC [Aldersonia sp. NBC_00410]